MRRPVDRPTAPEHLVIMCLCSFCTVWIQTGDSQETRQTDKQRAVLNHQLSAQKHKTLTHEYI